MAIQAKLLKARSILSRARRFLPRRPAILQPHYPPVTLPARLAPPAPEFAHLYAVARHAPSEGSQPDVQYPLRSCLVTERYFRTPEYRTWCARLREQPRLHRKQWEFYYICQALSERGLLQPGRRGLGFAVGEEPLPALFAAYGCEIVASDLAADDPRAMQWAQSNEHAAGLAKLNSLGLCEPAKFDRLVSFRVVDMNRIPEDLRDFDFTWSACAFEHVGSIDLGLRFIHQQLKCLKPGGVAVHTTEFNLTSNTHTLELSNCVLFRRRDIEKLVCELVEAGHHVEPLDLDLGSEPLDVYVDIPPFSRDRHLRLQLDKYASTSIGLIIRKGDGASMSGPKQPPSRAGAPLCR